MKKNLLAIIFFLMIVSNNFGQSSINQDIDDKIEHWV